MGNSEGRKLEHPVAKLSVVVEIVGFSDIESAAEEKRTGDDKKVMETQESIPYILYWLWYPDVDIDHFSNYILHIVVYEQFDSYDECVAVFNEEEQPSLPVCSAILPPKIDCNYMAEKEYINKSFEISKSSQTLSMCHFIAFQNLRNNFTGSMAQKRSCFGKTGENNALTNPCTWRSLAAAEVDYMLHLARVHDHNQYVVSTE
ncbi:hypothetical protein TNCV_1064951 [Trichonephila clavipes]|nr:hypothetical protein TNCV_1064951 [Trichonephila clavipes]